MIDGHGRPPAVSKGNRKQPALLIEFVPLSLPDDSIMFRNWRRLFQKPALADTRTGENRDFGGRHTAGANPQASDFSNGRKAIGGQTGDGTGLQWFRGLSELGSFAGMRLGSFRVACESIGGGPLDVAAHAYSVAQPTD